MKQTAMLTTASLLTILSMTVHLAEDILFKMAPAGLVNLLVVFIFVVQLYGMLVLLCLAPNPTAFPHRSIRNPNEKAVRLSEPAEFRKLQFVRRTKLRRVAG